MQRRVLGVVVLGVGVVGAVIVGRRLGRDGAPAVQPAPSAAMSAAAPERSNGARSSERFYDKAKVEAVVNPLHEAPYTGETGVVRGIVRIRGDEAPATPIQWGAARSSGCASAESTYGKLFRAGAGGVVADALVTVTGYSGYVPARNEASKVTISGCAFGKRTVAVAFGQRVEVSNLDPIESYMPFLDGAPIRAVMVAMPKGSPVKMYPQEPGHYLIRDQLPKPFLLADVFVLKYATHDVTGTDGQFRIEGVPVGEVKVTAYLPAINKDVSQTVQVKPGDNSVDFVLDFSAAKDTPTAKK